jgi:hypothetical protein
MLDCLDAFHRSVHVLVLQLQVGYQGVGHLRACTFNCRESVVHSSTGSIQVVLNFLDRLCYGIQSFLGRPKSALLSKEGTMVIVDRTSDFGTSVDQGSHSLPHFAQA